MTAEMNWHGSKSEAAIALLTALHKLGRGATAKELADASGTGRRAAGQRMHALHHRGLVTRVPQHGRVLAERVDLYELSAGGRAAIGVENPRLGDPPPDAPTVRQVVEMVEQTYRPEGVLIVLKGANGNLEGRAPIDLLDTPEGRREAYGWALALAEGGVFT